MKSSNPKVMIAAYRLLVARLSEEGADWNYPIHLGVTEAGEGEDARIKSAIGIGSLLADGIGDTIRVSLTEDSIHEIPEAKALVDSVAAGVSPANPQRSEVSGQRSEISFDPFSYQRRTAKKLEREGVQVGGDALVRVVIRKEQHEKIAHKIERMGDYKPEIVFENASVIEVDPRDDETIARVNDSAETGLVTVKDGIDLPMIAAFRLLAAKLQSRHPILLKDTLDRPAANDEARMVRAGLRHSFVIPCEARRHSSFVISPHPSDCIDQHRFSALRRHWRRNPGARRRGARTIAAFELQHFAGGRCAHFQNRLCRLPELWPHPVQSANDDGPNQSGDCAFKRSQNRDHGLHRKRAGRNGGCGIWLGRKSTGQGES